MAFIKVIDYPQAEGRLKEIYDYLIKKRGKLADVHKIQSLNPESILKHMDLYLHIMFGSSPLKRYQREMIAVVVSINNQCSYCVTHHGEALLHFWKDDGKLANFIKDYYGAGLNAKDLALCRLAETLTIHPSQIDEAYHKDQLKQPGLDDRSILDASLIIAYFNFVNRLVLGLGVELEADSGTGYEYE
ncbi:MAG: peroxidase-related enzyme [Bacteroidetes bacterium]|nr:peroxidase-related enzyme [Bacteroidota bacterium]